MLGWIRKISLADLFTLGNGLLGFLAITYVIDGLFIYAGTLMVLAIALDGLDGAVARYFGSKHSIGHVLDSISDTVSFCFAPAVLLYKMFYDISGGSALSVPPTPSSLENALVIVASFLVLAFGILRLARFSKEGYKEDNFSGIPTPATTFFVVILCFLFGTPSRNSFELSTEPFLVLPLVIIVAFLMLMDIGYPKIRGKLDIIGAGFLLLGLVPAMGLFILKDTGTYVLLARSSSLIALLLISSYIAGGPFYIYWRDRNQGN